MSEHGIQFALPLSDPILQGLVILSIILLSPIILNRFKIPNLLGLIVAGAVIGPYGFGLMERDSNIVFMANSGILYIMFLAGLEIDLIDFKKNKQRGLVFGLYTFLFPMLITFSVGYYFLQLTFAASMLTAAMLASHTLIAYPLVSQMGITKNPVVTVSVAGTLVTDVLSLLVLAVIVDSFHGQPGTKYWFQMAAMVAAFAFVVLYIFPIFARWFLKRYADNILQYIFVLFIVFLSSLLAGASGLEPIIGAFFAGLALNSLIPHTSPLMNRIEFVGNAIFIPYFLIGVGMLINYQAFFKGVETIKMGLILTVLATLSKYIAAWVTQKTFRFSALERSLIFGLSNARVAVTLATVLIGYNIIIGEDHLGNPIRLLSENILNGSILMILFSSTIGSFATQRAAKKISEQEESEKEIAGKFDMPERLLIPLSNHETVPHLINLGATVKSKNTQVYALNVIDKEVIDGVAEKKGNKILDQAQVAAAAIDQTLYPVLRYDINIVNAITSVVKENKITDLIMGLHHRSWLSDSFLGYLTHGILTRCNTTTMIYKATQPLGTIKKYIVVVPHLAEREIGFALWLRSVHNLAVNSDAQLTFYTTAKTMKFIRETDEEQSSEYLFQEFEDWTQLRKVGKSIQKNEGLILVLSRENELSYLSDMKRVPSYLNRHFRQNSFILIYPMQQGVGTFFSKYSKADFKSPSILASVDRLSAMGQNLKDILLGRKK